GGTAADGEDLSLLARGQACGPPHGVPLLFVVADLGRDEPGLPPSAQSPNGTVRQRLLRARVPVVEILWTGGRIRVGLHQMTWRGLPGYGLSAADNLLRTLPP